MGVLRKDSIGDSVIDDFDKLFANYSIKNQTYGRIILHVVLGQALCKNVYYRMGARKIDIRVHLLLIKPQATGKGAGYNICNVLSEKLGLDFQTITKITDAGLEGTKIYDPVQKEEIIVDGLLKTADIIGMEEGSPIFDMTSEFSKMVMTNMQITMNSLFDSDCHISKRLGTKLIEFDPHASFIITSYPPDKLAEKITKTGFLDRMITVFESVSLDERLEILQKMTQMTNMKKEDLQAMQDDFLERFEGIINFFKKGDYCIEISQEMEDTLLTIIEDFAMQVFDASPKAREKLEHFVTRLYEVLKKLAIHHTIINLRTRVQLEDLLYARMTYLPIWKNLIIHIESLLIIDPSERARRNRIIKDSLDEYDRLLLENKYVKGEHWVRRSSMIPNLQLRWDNCSAGTANNNLQLITKSTNIDKDQFKKIAKLEEKDKFFEAQDIGGFMYIKKIKEI